MKLENLSSETLSRIATYRWDRIIEKHEGPWEWGYLVNGNHVDFLTVDGFNVLLPVDKEKHGNIHVDRCIVSCDGKTLTIFLRDTTYGTDIFDTGYMAVCEKVPEEDWFIAIIYHECWISHLETIN